MKYAIVIYEGEQAFAARSNGQQDEYWGAWTAYTKAISEAGVITGGSALQPPATATTVRGNNGARLVHDGPYADTKEQLGGFILIDVKDLDTAMDWAARCPAVAWGGAVEVRPLQESC